jgi:hypothetical protein
MYMALVKVEQVPTEILVGCGKTWLMPTRWLEWPVRCEWQNTVRMLKKAVHQGRSKRWGEAYASVR